METLEKILWSLLKKHLPDKCDFQRIETGSTGLGIPDLNVCHEGQDVWIELKIVKGRQVHLSPQQVAWHFRRWRAGGRTFILARDKADGVRKGKYDRIFIWPGNLGHDVLEKGVAAEGGWVFESPFDWAAVNGVIFAKL